MSQDLHTFKMGPVVAYLPRNCKPPSGRRHHESVALPAVVLQKHFIVAGIKEHFNESALYRAALGR
jgi:hypothetical protein